MRTTAFIAAVSASALHAQDGGLVRVQLDRDSIPLGGRAVLTMEVDGIGSAVTWPVIGDTLTRHIEVVRDSGPDTTTEMRLVRKLALTSFDTGYWALPPLRFSIGSRQVESEALLLHVQGLVLDSAAVPADIKPIYEPPFSLLWFLEQHWRWVAGAAGIVLAGILLVVLLKRARRKKPEVEPPALVIPLHERVLRDLDALERARLWQQGDHKGYQSRLTDLLRGYIEERYAVPALERTTDELLHELRVSPLTGEQQTLIANMLRSADMVKFAKALPGPQENEQMMSAAVRFVRDTAPMIHEHAPRS